MESWLHRALVALVSVTLLIAGCSGNDDPAPPAEDALPQVDPLDPAEPDPPIEEDGIVLIESAARIGDQAIVAVALGDLDGDGDLDLVTAGAAGARVWKNDGTGIFEGADRDLGGDADAGASSLALGDLDGDGDLDLVAGFFARNLAGFKVGAPDLVFLNDGAGSMVDSGQRIGTDLTRSVALGDVDEDGDLDLITGAQGRNRLRLGDGQGRFPFVAQSLGNYITTSVALGDLDADGHLDVVEGDSRQVFLDGALSYEPNRVWFRYESTLPYFPNLVYYSDQALGRAETLSLALGDLDGDGSLDLLEGSAGADEIWVNDGTGTFTAAGQPLWGGATNGVGPGDLDGDGDLDIVEATNAGLVVWENLGALAFEGMTVGETEAAAACLVLGDLDGDGDLDVVVGYQDGARAFLNGTP